MVSLELRRHHKVDRPSQRRLPKEYWSQADLAHICNFAQHIQEPIRIPKRQPLIKQVFHIRILPSLLLKWNEFCIVSGCAWLK